MIERDPIGNDARQRRRQGELGPHAVCVVCGERELPALRRVKASLLERHHVAGAANDPDLTVVVCRNCHAKLTAEQARTKVALARDPERSMPEKLVEVLRGLALFFAYLARACAAWADRLTTLVAQLDENQPGWRSLPGAQG